MRLDGNVNFGMTNPKQVEENDQQHQLHVDHEQTNLDEIDRIAIVDGFERSKNDSTRELQNPDTKENRTLTRLQKWNE